MTLALKVFISYARTDARGFAEQLYTSLKMRGIAAWRDERNLNPYADFSVEIEQAILWATHVVVCVSASIKQRPDSFVRREINEALIQKNG
jgi:hypothetical protein